MNKARIVFFADAGPHVGMGHVMRCLPVMAELRKFNAEVLMVTPLDVGSIRGLGLKDTISVADNSRAASRAIVEVKPTHVVADSYRFINDICHAAHSTGKPSCTLFDDHYAPEVNADIIINASPAAKERNYRKGAAKIFILGPQYASIGSVFATIRRRYKVRDDVKRVLVSLGGSDLHEQIERLVRMLDKSLPKSTELLVAGNVAKGLESTRVKCLGWVGQDEFAKIMSRCDLGVLAGGTMVVQAACVGFPVIAWPQNIGQLQHSAVWGSLGTLIRVEQSRDLPAAVQEGLDMKCRMRMWRAGRRIVDGRGAHRIAQILIDTLNSAG